MKIIEAFDINSLILAVIMLLMVETAGVHISSTDNRIIDKRVVYVT